MITSTERSKHLIYLLNHASEIDENCVVEYKVEPHSRNYDCEFYKDVLALLNSCDRPDEDRWIIYGVTNQDHALLGFSRDDRNLLDDADYQQKFRKIAPWPTIELIVLDAVIVLGEEGHGKLFAALYIPKENVGEVYEMAAQVIDKLGKGDKHP